MVVMERLCGRIIRLSQIYIHLVNILLLPSVEEGWKSYGSYASKVLDLVLVPILRVMV
jgi:hypothetical protein